MKQDVINRIILITLIVSNILYYVLKQEFPDLLLLLWGGIY